MMMEAPTQTTLFEQLREFTLGAIDERQLDTFVEPRAMIDNEDQATPLLARLCRDLAAPADDAPMSYLIQGDAGFGKTTLSGYLCRRLWDAQNTWLPIYIHLPQIPDDKLSDVLSAYLKANFNKAARRTIQQQPLLVFLDGFDELHATVRQQLQTQHGLFGANQWQRRQAPIRLVTCARPAALAQLNLNSLFAVPEKPGSTTRTFVNYQLQLFNPEQRVEYIDRFIAQPPVELHPDWQTPDPYYDAIERLPGLAQIIATPFLLSIVLRVLPNIVDQYPDDHDLTRSNIYDVFIQHWIAHHLHRQPPGEMLGLRGNLKDYLYTYAQNLAASLLQGGQINERALKASETLKPLLLEPRERDLLIHYEAHDRAFFAGEIDADGIPVPEAEQVLRCRRRLTYIRDACLLPTQGSGFRFLHKSIAEFLAAKELFGGLLGAWDILLRTVDIDEHQFETQGLNRQNLREEPEILARLIEQIQQRPNAQALLGNLVSQSREIQGLSTLAANAMTLMNRMGFDFSGEDFTDIQIPGADLRGSCCVQTNFTGADLSHAWFHGATLTLVNLQGSNLCGADFGEKVPLIHKNTVKAIAHYQPPIPDAGEPLGYWLVGCGDGYIYQWSAYHETLKRKMNHGKYWRKETSVTSLAVSHQQHRLVSGGSDECIRLWHLISGKCLKTFKGHTSLVSSVALSADGTLLASGSWDTTCRLWDTNTGALKHTLEGHTGWVLSVALSAAGTLLASGSWDGTCRLWDTNTGALKHTLEGHTGWVLSVALSAAGTLLASGSRDRTCRLWDTNTGAIKHTLKGYTHKVYSVALSAAGTLLASGSKDDTCRLWDTNTGAIKRTFEGHTDTVTSIALSAAGTLLASGSKDDTCRLWDTNTGALKHTLQGHTNWVISVALSAAGTLLASGSWDKTCRLWDTNTGALKHTLEGHTDNVNSVALSADGTRLASGSWDNTCQLWDTNTGALKHTLEGHTSRVSSVALSADGTLLASGSKDHTCRLWDTNTGAIKYTLEGHTNTVLSVALSAAGTLLASGSWDGTCRLWDTNTGALKHTLEGYTGWVSSVALSAEGTLLASGDTTCRLWDTNTGALKHKLKGHTDHVLSVALSADGTLLASGSKDKTCRLWDLRMNRCLSTVDVGDYVHALSFCIDKPELIVAYGHRMSRFRYQTSTGDTCWRPLRNYGHTKLWLQEINVTQACIATPSLKRLFEYHQAQGKPAPVGSRPPAPYCALFQPLADTASAKAQSAWVRTEQDLQISHDLWVVSLARDTSKSGGLFRSRTGGWAQHVFLVIEGIRQHRRFILRADLTTLDGNQVEITLKPLDDAERFMQSVAQYETQQWNITAAQGRTLIQNIRADQRRTLSYNQRGGGGIDLGAEYFNCVSWAMKQLRQLDDPAIVLRDRWYHFLVALPRDAIREAQGRFYSRG